MRGYSDGLFSYQSSMPAHQGMETRGAGLWKDSGVIGGASPCRLAGANLPSILAKFR